MNLLDPSFQGFLWVIAIGLTVIVLDVFFETEILSVFALLGISVYFSLLFDLSLKWQALITIGCWLAVTALFYAVWKRFVAPVIRRCLPSGSDEAIHSAVGARGEFRRIDGKNFVSWNGDLWPVDLEPDEEDGFEDRQRVIIAAVDRGVFSVTRPESS